MQTRQTASDESRRTSGPFRVFGDAVAADVPAFFWRSGEEILVGLGTARHKGGLTFVALPFEDPRPEADGAVCLCPDLLIRRPAVGSPAPSRTAHRLASDGLYPALVSEALRDIAAGWVEKVVVGRSFDVELERPVDIPATLQALCEQFPGCRTFGVRTPGGGLFAGATPEWLVRVHEGHVEVDAIAGTAQRGPTPAEDAAWAQAMIASDKVRREHGVVVDEVVRALEPVTRSLSYPPRPRLMKLANVQHLHTPVAGELLPGVTPWELVAALHPTPAVGGLPRETARELIRRLEPRRRGLYTGVVGWIDDDCAELAVALRCGSFRGRNVRLYAGAGIVAGSDPDQEDEEVRLKASALLGALREAR